MKELLLPALTISLFYTFSSMGQTTMDVNAWRTNFNTLSDELRVVITNDPECGGCLYLIQQQMNVVENPASCGLNDGIKYIFNWTKVLGTTTISAANTQTANHPEPNKIHYWDEHQLLSDLLFTTLDLVDPSGTTSGNTAWHTTLCYEPGIVWNETDSFPPMPTFWIHKLTEDFNADQSLFYSDSLFMAGFSPLACLMDVEEDNLSDKLNIRGNGSANIIIDLLDVTQNSLITVTSLDGRLVMTVPCSGRKSISISDQLTSGEYILTLIQEGSPVGSARILYLR